MKYFVGIDPGKTGGIAIINSEGHHDYSSQFTSWKWHGRNLISYKEQSEGLIVALEKVGAMPKQGVKSMFTFGANFGGWVSLLEYFEIPYILVPPQRWQKKILGVIPKGESKQRAFAYTSSRFPLCNIKKSHTGVIDALCLALYVRDQ